MQNNAPIMLKFYYEYTTLALKFCENKDYLYFFVNPKKTEMLLIEEFLELLKTKVKIEEYVKPKNWEEFFALLFEKYNGIVIFDEFQWFLDINQQVPFILQKYIDKKKEFEYNYPWFSRRNDEKVIRKRRISSFQKRKCSNKTRAF